MASVIHLLGWAAVTLMAAHSYNHRFSPSLIAARKEHRMELPALGYGLLMVAVLIALFHLTGVSTPPATFSFPEPQVIWLPIV